MPITPDFQIRTKQLVVRPLTSADLTTLHAKIMSDPDVMKHIGNGAVRTEVEAGEFLQRVIAGYGESDFGWFGMSPLTDVKELSGVACLKPLAGELRTTFGEHIEVGYWLAKNAWGKGLATEAAAALLRRGFVDLQLAEIVAVAQTENAASNRVLQKVGMTHRKNVLLNDVPVDFYTLEREEYMRTPYAE